MAKQRPKESKKAEESVKLLFNRPKERDARVPVSRFQTIMETKKPVNFEYSLVINFHSKEEILDSMECLVH